MSKLSTESYKGVRDFYPEEQFVQNYIFGIWRKTLESFGYVEYGASILEPAELYKQKSGDEIISEQTYTFKDRGDREVTLRPEMTPTIARMVAGKRRELGFPLRWYSIPNLFRYEAPQRGRLREHWQLNADIFGVKTIEADIEIIAIAHKIMQNFGAKDDDFLIRLNSRKVMNKLYALFDLDEVGSHKISKLIDKKNKISGEEFLKGVSELLGDKAEAFVEVLNSPEKIFDRLGKDSPEIQEIFSISSALEAIGISNITFDQTLMRGFDYYTGVVFEVFDTNKDNPRSLFGGGRYDDLLSLFSDEQVPAVGFGSGDVTMQDFLETHNLLPKYRPSTDIFMVLREWSDSSITLGFYKLVNELQKLGVNMATRTSDKEAGDLYKTAEKLSIPYIAFVDAKALSDKQLVIKNMQTREEYRVSTDKLADISNFIKK